MIVVVKGRFCSRLTQSGYIQRVHPPLMPSALSLWQSWHGIVAATPWRRLPGVLAAKLAADLAAERDRWVLWIPVGLGFGIALYFALVTEPPLWLGPALVLLCAAAGLFLRRGQSWWHWGLFAAALAVGTAATGFTAAQIRTIAVAAPVLSERVGPTTVSGRVDGVEVLGGRMRVTLSRVQVWGTPAASTPRRVRISLKGTQPPMRPGAWVRVRAVLMPPAAPAAPGAFDFQRQSWFAQLGAIGYGLGAAKVTAETGVEGLDRFTLAIGRLRHEVTERVRAQVDGATGEVTTALMTGERGGIPPHVLRDIRDSGLAHLLAISGLHMGLVAGFLFVGVRRALALVPPVALRFPIKKWAAAAAIVGAAGYGLLAGATVPTQRAFLMIGLILVAVMLDRRGLSMRSVAWAATVILLLTPESLLTASFQLSFAAVVALIAAYEVVRERRRRRLGEPLAWPMRVLRYLGGVALTTAIAGTVTAPFAVFHFNRFAGYGLAANLLAVPVTALWVMPWAVIAFVLMPFGLDALALTPMGWGVDVVLRVAAAVAAWPGAVATLPAAPISGLAVLTLGGLWLCLWRRRWRLLGIAGIAIGIVVGVNGRPPDVLIDGAAKLVAVREESGDLAVSSQRAATFARNAWLQRNGQDTKPTLWPKTGATGDGRLRCGGDACIYRVPGRSVVIHRQPPEPGDACLSADVVVSLVPLISRCPDATTVIDPARLRSGGAHGIWLGDDRLRVESVNALRGDRPWVLRVGEASGASDDGKEP